jgi:preprotein translocase subunit SecA
VEYQREGYGMFIDMMAGIREEAVQFLFNIELKQAEPQVQVQQPQQLTFSAPDEQGDVDSHKEQNPVASQAQKPKQGGSGSAFFKN